AAGRESRTHTIPAGFARNTKPQPCRLLVEGAHDYSGGSKMPEYLVCALRVNEAEQGRATDNLDAGLRQQLVELLRSARQSDASGGNPSIVCKGPLGNGNGGGRSPPPCPLSLLRLRAAPA